MVETPRLFPSPCCPLLPDPRGLRLWLVDEERAVRPEVGSIGKTLPGSASQKRPERERTVQFTRRHLEEMKL
jgi:hypothetical protein